jgi:hypothetical protein
MDQVDNLEHTIVATDLVELEAEAVVNSVKHLSRNA